ncbi:unnamed protein product, partial [Iphiclides podalirius]
MDGDVAGIKSVDPSEGRSCLRARIPRGYNSRKRGPAVSLAPSQAGADVTARPSTASAKFSRQPAMIDGVGEECASTEIAPRSDTR